MDRVAPTETHAYVHNGQKVYEWNQTLSDINIFIDLPPGARAKDLAVSFTTARLTKDLAGAIKVSDSLWTVEDGILVLQLVKAQTGVTWPAAIAGHEVSPDVQTTDQKRLMLERFQAEHPGFDFSQAEFNGAVPDPSTFLKDLPGH
ncbi:NudC domain-containing protein 2 [Auxenochlorella protothecoides]|uniref:NudC domain-containing protein 2 n=1 Tax=Auxenochlorella protothecoides TaxID=3075 RepID=A0A087SAG1_AUXPR|nr:NudC domain-containing protein 2 [Auxenochlorella protothecoides]KFM22715.1 NudC domain-containing protein 2 [Auxenochlorella protothecoides]